MSDCALEELEQVAALPCPRIRAEGAGGASVGPSASRGGGGTAVTQAGPLHGQACAGHSTDMGHAGTNGVASAGGTAGGTMVL